MTKLFLAKAWLGGAGLVACLVGMALEWRWLVYLAVGLLAVAFALRFADKKTAREP